MLTTRLPLVLSLLTASSLVLAAGSQPAGWDWPVAGQLWIKCVADTNANGQVARVLSVEAGSTNLALLSAQLALRYGPGSTQWSDPRAWDLPVLSFGALAFSGNGHSGHGPGRRHRI